MRFGVSGRARIGLCSLHASLLPKCSELRDTHLEPEHVREICGSIGAALNTEAGNAWCGVHDITCETARVAHSL